MRDCDEAYEESIVNAGAQLRVRYKQARTLVRGVRRLPGEGRAEFRAKIRRLREHFEQFNKDVADLCQWLMWLRKQYGPAENPASFGVVGDFLLEPRLDGVQPPEDEPDRWRLAVFDGIAGIRQIDRLGRHPVPAELRTALAVVRNAPLTESAQRLFARLRGVEPSQRLVLLKSAAEWVVGRYVRGMENWVRQREHWEREKAEWERNHPALTEEVRTQFTNIFASLADPDRDGRPGVKRKKPRICPYARLAEGKDNCIYAGEKGHGPLCWKYVGFVNRRKEQGRFNEKHFAENAASYIRLRHGRPRRKALEMLYAKVPQCRAWFERAWDAYLREMGLNEQTVVQHGRLPHCLNIGKTGAESRCEWNPHTELCRRYKAAVDRLPEDLRALEGEYREWRGEYLAGPRKPQFRYPSSRNLPTPKIFGRGYYEVDLERSVVRLRLGGVGDGEWVELGITPWPRGYRPSRKEAAGRITSVHVHFVGTRARIGLRFEVAHRESRFGCMQEEIDLLRSREYPRRAQDQAFLDAARERLVGSFAGDADREMRVLAVDLGETGAAAAVFRGRQHEGDVHLAVVKIDRKYPQLPEVLEKDQAAGREERFDPRSDPRGLRKEHVGRHLHRRAQILSEVTRRRRESGAGGGTIGAHDLRRLERHVEWMIRDWARNVAAEVIRVAEEWDCHVIVLESLRGFRAPGYDQLDEAKKRRMGMFAYGRVRRKITEKAVERGMRVVTVPYVHSSQVCSECGHVQQDKGRWRTNKLKHRSFRCECSDPKAKRRDSAAGGCRCQAQTDSDRNAARVLGRVFWGEIRLPAAVQRPGGVDESAGGG